MKTDFVVGDLVSLSLDGTTTIGRYVASVAENYEQIGIITFVHGLRGRQGGRKKVRFVNVYWPFDGTTKMMDLKFLAHYKPETP